MRIGMTGQMVGGLPYDEELIYLSSSDSRQYIDLGIYGNIGVDYEIKAKCTGSATYQSLFGDRYSSTERRCTIMVAPSIGDIYFYCGTSNQVIDSHSIVTDDLTYKKDGLACYVNGSLKGSFINQSYTTPNTLLLFATRTNGVVSYGFTGLIYYAKVADLDLMAVLKNGEPCMFDRASKRIFRNAGAGTFGYKKKDGTVVAPT